MKRRSNSVPRDLLGSECQQPSSSRIHLLPAPMFSGHKAEFRSLLPHRKATLRMRAPKPPHWHYHIERQYEDLYEPSPSHKKAKLRAARFNIGLSRPRKLSEKNFFFVTEAESSNSNRSLHLRSCSSRTRCSEVISRAESLLAAEKENTSRIMSGYRRVQGGRIAGNRELLQIAAGHRRTGTRIRKMLML